MQSVTIGGNQAGQRLDKFLHKYLPNAGNGFLYKMLRKKNITLNGRKAEGPEMLVPGDTVAFFFSEETFAKFSGLEQCNTASQSTQNAKAAQRTEVPNTEITLIRESQKAYHLLQGITVLYEDENILVLNKPDGVLTQKADKKDSSLNEWLIGYLLERDPLFQRELHTFRPSVCNRLDRNTSGIVLCGKSLAGSQYLSRCIRERTIRKFYRTICVGCLKEPQAIYGYLAKDTERNRVTVWEDGDKAPYKADPIHTAYTPLAWSEGMPQHRHKNAMRDNEVLQNHGALQRHKFLQGREALQPAEALPSCGYTLLEVELITGKTHQIRAHLAGIGHPLIGDFKYGSPDKNNQLKERYGLSHQLLHACRAEFPRSEDGVGRVLSGMVVCAPCPEAFIQLQNALNLT